jgi:hypothetical protein
MLSTVFSITPGACLRVQIFGLNSRLVIAEIALWARLASKAGPIAVERGEAAEWQGSMHYGRSSC